MTHGSAIVVPGHSRRGRVSARCLGLLEVAARLAARDGTRAVVFTGRARGGASEAEQMRDAWPGRLDVDLLVEPTARTTAENAARSLRLLLERGIAEATVVCAPHHARRVRFFFGGLYARYGVRCEIYRVPGLPRPAALLRELAAAAVARRQLRRALAELEAALHV